eukprot:3352132-Pleurochrysis_carterae.AAC.5
MSVLRDISKPNKNRDCLMGTVPNSPLLSSAFSCSSFAASKGVWNKTSTSPLPRMQHGLVRNLRCSSLRLIASEEPFRSSCTTTSSAAGVVVSNTADNELCLIADSAPLCSCKTSATRTTAMNGTKARWC